MCVICIKPHNVPMVDEETLSNMWVNNPDGAGFMYAKDGKVHIQKGYMTYNAFSKALDELRKSIDLDKTSIILHFRITTHGGTKPENCHPFPVTDSVGMLKKIRTTAQLGVAHNGIINISPRKGISDTMEYIASQLGPLQKAVPKFYKDKNLMQMISNAIDSKMAFMDKEGKIYTIGNFVEEGGVKYSNTSYKAYRWSKSLYDYYDGKSWNAYDYYGNAWSGSAYKTYGSASTSKRTEWCYSEKAIMWLDDTVGDYIVTKGGELVQGDYGIDCKGNVYLYSDRMNTMIYKEGFTAFDKNGMYLKFDANNVNTTFESCFGPSYVKGALPYASDK